MNFKLRLEPTSIVLTGNEQTLGTITMPNKASIINEIYVQGTVEATLVIRRESDDQLIFAGFIGPLSPTLNRIFSPQSSERIGANEILEITVEGLSGYTGKYYIEIAGIQQ